MTAMLNRWRFLIAATSLISFLFAVPAWAQVETRAAGIIKIEVGTRGPLQELTVQGRTVKVTRMMRRFYRHRNFMPAWSSSHGPYEDINELLDAVRMSYEDGLNPADYPADEIAGLLNTLLDSARAGKPLDPAMMADLDLLSTSTFLALGYHLLAGRIYPEITDGEWADNIWEADLDDALSDALASGTIAETLSGIAPPSEEYAALKNALASYREISSAGGWPVVPYGKTMRPGDRSSRVKVLRNRLLISGDLVDNGGAVDNLLFDDAVEQAVLRFQKRHGLVPDGVVGPNTLAAINVPISKRIRQLELNMERWRWLPENLGDRYIFVNTAAFELKVVDSGSTVMRMKIVVGKPYWHTPSFSAKMTYLIVNPSWYVPSSIAVDDIVPHARENPDYITKSGYRILSGGNGDATELDPASIDWQDVTEDNLGFRLVEPPGPHNPLGRIKFMFPNRFSVYLHDTPSKSLFNRKVRTFSHGCIRIEKPVELAKYLVPDVDFDELIAKGETVKVELPEPIMVHSLYWTAWVDKDGTINFRDDIYGRDEALQELLSYGPMTP